MQNSESDIPAQTRTTDCCGDRRTETDGGSDYWLDDSDVLEAELPAELQSAFGNFVGEESVGTLRAWVHEIRRFTGGGSIAVEQLCHSNDETDHWGAVDGERYHFLCFYDAVVLSAIEERPVDIHTVSPDGTVVEARAVENDELTVTPEDAVFSFGIGENAGQRSDGNPTVEDAYGEICPYVRAFPDREAYEQWAREVPAVTVAMPLAGATDVAGALVD